MSSSCLRIKVFTLFNSLFNWPELEVIRLLMYQLQEANSHPELLELEGPFICRASLAAFVMGWAPYVASGPMWESLCSLPSRVYCSVIDSRARRGWPTVKYVLGLYLQENHFENIHEYLPVCQLLLTWKHLVLPSDYIILTSLMCKWAVLSRSQSFSLVIIEHPSQVLVPKSMLFT